MQKKFYLIALMELLSSVQQKRMRTCLFSLKTSPQKGLCLVEITIRIP